MLALTSSIGCSCTQPPSNGLGSGAFMLPLVPTATAPTGAGRYLTNIKQVPSCATAPVGAQMGVDCIDPAQLPANTTQGLLVQWEGLIESPFMWMTVGGSVVAGGVIGALIGAFVSKRRRK